jgi:tetratricopeptide (TPR) repeat protein
LLGRKDARALVARLGGETADEVSARTTMLVVGSEGFGPAPDPDPSASPGLSRPPSPPASASPAGARSTPSAREGRPARERTNKLKRAEELNAEPPAHIDIISEDEFCRLVGVPTPDALKRQYHAMRDLLARYRSLREDHLRYLVKCGVIRPILRTNADTYFAFPDLAVIRQANDELGQGAAFRSVVRGLIASCQGQMAFDFRLDAAPAKILTLHRRVAAPSLPPTPVAAGEYDRADAEEYFRQASDLDDGDESRLEEAAAAYRKALELDPYLVAALINLANIHYSRDELAEAQGLYERAIGVESDFFEAHFNLGNIYHDLGQFFEAQRCYEEALRLNPFYADTHFYLAVTLEKLDQSGEARPHWRAYQQLAPQGEWVELAKEFSE